MTIRSVLIKGHVHILGVHVLIYRGPPLYMYMYTAMYAYTCMTYKFIIILF